MYEDGNPRLTTFLTFSLVALIGLMIFAAVVPWVRHFVEPTQPAGIASWQSLPTEIKREMLREPWTGLTLNNDVRQEKVYEKKEVAHEKRRGISRDLAKSNRPVIEQLDHLQ